MTHQLFLYLGSFLVFAWGIAHLFPTKSVVRGFGGISIDNQRIVAMEWLAEGIFLIFIGTVAACVTYVDHTSLVSKTVYRISFVFLNVMSVVSFFTGFRINFPPFKLCPFIFTTSSLLIVLGVYL